MDLIERIQQNTRDLLDACNRYDRDLPEMSDEELAARRDRLQELVNEGKLLQAEYKIENAFGLVEDV